MDIRDRLAWRTVALRCLLAAGLAGGALPATSRASSDVALSEYILTSWTTKDGLPSDVIWSIVGDREGYLWLGTNGGLVRFDGARFVVWERVGATTLPKQTVRSLLSSRDGSLWVGFGEGGGAIRVRGGEARTFGTRDGLAPGLITALIEDLRGTIWAGTTTGLFRLNGDHWQHVSGDSGLPGVRVDSLYVDKTGNLFVGTAAGTFRLTPDEDTFQQVERADDVPPVFRGFSQDPSGQIWVTDPVVGFRRLGERNAPERQRERARGNRLLHDREGNLWVGTMGGGIWRVSHDQRASRERIEKASISGARSIFEDREGQIWTAAGDGLTRLAKAKVTRVMNLGLVYGVQSTPDGSVWATTADSLIRFPRASRAPRGIAEALHHQGIRTLRADEYGVLWVVTNSSLERFSADRRSYPLPTTPVSLNRINAIESDRHGGLWISDRDHGLFRWSPQRPNIIEPVRALADQRVAALYSDRPGRLWFASTSGRVGVVESDGGLRAYGDDAGLSIGANSVMYEDSRHILWFGVGDGLVRFSDGRFFRVVQQRFRGGVIGIAEDEDGDLWLGTPSGIVHVARGELDKSAADPQYSVRASVFDTADGLAGLPVSFGNPIAVRASDGRIWFITGRGLTAFEPGALKSLRPPARVLLEGVEVDEHSMSATVNARLPARTSRVVITYSTLDLTTPWKTLFRYRLDGFDTQWIEAGAHRQAVYTGLPPGSYRFLVAAANRDGSWSNTTTSWDFSVRPMFYQTNWFYAASSAALGLLAWAAWRLRVRRLRRQFAVLLGERARLSREIHDTLLQSLVGVTLQFDAVCNGLESSSPTRQHLVRIRKQVEEYIREARHSIWNLRAPLVGAKDLPQALREAAERVAAGRPIGFEFTLCGTPYPCSPDADEQLVRICQEAVLNAIRHADARLVRVELRYDPDSVVLRVSDDGRGFDPAAAIRLEAAGHYGLVSMRERAAQVGGVFTLTTAHRSGTQIEARVPVVAHAA